MNTYRIYTENKNANEVIEHASYKFESFTYFTGIGYWKRAREDSLVIEFIGSKSDLDTKVNVFADWIQKHNRQDAVLVTVTECEVRLI